MLVLSLPRDVVTERETHTHIHTHTHTHRLSLSPPPVIQRWLFRPFAARSLRRVCRVILWLGTVCVCLPCGWQQQHVYLCVCVCVCVSESCARGASVVKGLIKYP